MLALIIGLFLPVTKQQKVIVYFFLYFEYRTKWPAIGAFCYVLSVQVCWNVLWQFLYAVDTAVLLHETTSSYMLQGCKIGCGVGRRIAQRFSHECGEVIQDTPKVLEQILTHIGRLAKSLFGTGSRSYQNRTAFERQVIETRLDTNWLSLETSSSYVPQGC